MAQFLDLFGFVSVLLRAATLSLSAITVGGIVFALLLRDSSLPPSTIRLLRLAAFGLAITQVLYVVANSAILSATTGLDFGQLTGASYFLWGCATAAAALAVAVTSFLTRSRLTATAQIFCSLLLLAGTVATSHAAARLEDRFVLLAATAVHQAAAACWIGALPYLLLTLRNCPDSNDAFLLARRFSALALASVVSLFAAGLVLSFFYIGDLPALYGTSYGVMVVAKGILFALILVLAAVNFRLIRGRGETGTEWLSWLGKISEAEIGIGITVILAAASLTSQPPAVDLKKDRADLATIEQRMAPRVPRMQTPPLSTLSPSTRQLWKKQHPPSSSNGETYVPGQQPWTPPTEGDIAWSEYNHHWAGLIVLVMGVLAVLSRFRWFRWARYWPLAFIGLAVFLLLRADPENWPLGPNGFWESFTSSDVSQHRLFVVLIVLFAFFEFGVQTGRLRASKAALVFPAVCASGGALLLTHMHAVTNLKEELLAELSHTPLAILAVAAGWSRWLEIRFPGPARVAAARIWPVCFALIGVVLLFYREA